MTEQQEFDLIIRTCVPPLWWDTSKGKPDCIYWFNRDGEGYWVNKGGGDVSFGPFKTIDRATRELRKVITGRIDDILNNKEINLNG
jgi:hypothetical protein